MLVVDIADGFSELTGASSNADTHYRLYIRSPLKVRVQTYSELYSQR